MKKLVLAVVTTIGLLTSVSQACQVGDTSKTLLLLQEADGEENAAVAEVDNQTGAITIDRQDYVYSGRSGQVVMIGSLGEGTFKFDLSTAYRSPGFCYPIVYGAN